MAPRTDYYTARGRMTHERWCGWDLCRLARCFGDKSRRSVKRGAKNRWRVELEDEIGDTRDDILEANLPDYCGDWCPCGDNLKNWMDWLRSLPVYPLQCLAVPLFEMVN